MRQAPFTLFSSLIASALVSMAVANVEAAETDCLGCNAPISPADDPCTDLFGAACVGANHKPTSKGLFQASRDKQFAGVREARDLGARALGYKDMNDAVVSRLKAAGIELTTPVSPEVLKSLLSEPGAKPLDQLENPFKSAADCQASLTALTSQSVSLPSDIATLKKHAAQQEAFTAAQNAQIVQVYARDIEGFINGHLAGQCKALGDYPELYPKKSNSRAYVSCENLTTLRRQAVKIYRQEDEPGHAERAQKFLSAVFVSDLVPANGATGAAMGSPYGTAYGQGYGYLPAGGAATGYGQSSPAETPEATQLRGLISSENLIMQRACASLGESSRLVSARVANELMNTVSLNKATIESLIDRNFSSERHQKLEKIFNELRSNAADLARKTAKDPATGNRIADEYQAVELFWMKKPDATEYVKDKNGNEIYDTERLREGLAKAVVLGDPKQTYYYTPNADYLPEVTIGKEPNSSRVNVNPMFLASTESNPLSMMAVVAHELGHKVGPHLSEINGHSLKDEWRPLLACYKDAKSIRMQDIQQDEVIADTVSAEILSHQILMMPAEKRRMAAIMAVTLFCTANDLDDHLHQISLTDSHPPTSLRISGIFGANPGFRKAMGCVGESPKYKSCSTPASLDTRENSPGAKPSDEPVRSAQ